MRAVGLIGAVMALSAVGQPAALLDEDFDGYRAGLFSSAVGAHTEYHYLPEAAAKGPWAASSFRSEIESQRAWRIVETGGDRRMAQVWQNKYVHCHPMIVAGEISWRDYTATIRFTPELSVHCYPCDVRSRQGLAGRRGLGEALPGNQAFEAEVWLCASRLR